MVQVIQETPGFGAMFGAGLGQGLSKGIEQYYQQKENAKQQSALMQQFPEFFQQAAGQQAIARPQQRQQSILPGMQAPTTEVPSWEQLMQNTMAQRQIPAGLSIPESIQAGAQQRQPQMQPQQQPAAQQNPQQQVVTKAAESPAAVKLAGWEAIPIEGRLALLANKNPAMARVMQLAYEAKNKNELGLIKLNEPERLQLVRSTSNLENDALKYDRLQELKNTGKFPNNVLVGIAQAIGKDGEINPALMSVLSPEAQEATKLLADMINGAKETFGARVTNFDLQSYLKRLPSLLNSPEGFDAIIRDLKLMNQISQLHNEGIWEAYDEAGGPGKISHSEAERRGKSKHLKEINQLKRDFLNPPAAKFAEMPDPKSEPVGADLTDTATGRRWINDGTRWVPVK